MNPSWILSFFTCTCVQDSAMTAIPYSDYFIFKRRALLFHLHKMLPGAVAIRLGHKLNSSVSESSRALSVWKGMERFFKFVAMEQNGCSVLTILQWKTWKWKFFVGYYTQYTCIPELHVHTCTCMYMMYMHMWIIDLLAGCDLEAVLLSHWIKSQISWKSKSPVHVQDIHISNLLHIFITWG